MRSCGYRMIHTMAQCLSKQGLCVCVQDEHAVSVLMQIWNRSSNWCSTYSVSSQTHSLRSPAAMQFVLTMAMNCAVLWNQEVAWGMASTLSWSRAKQYSYALMSKSLHWQAQGTVCDKRIPSHPLWTSCPSPTNHGSPWLDTIHACQRASHHPLLHWSLP